MYATFMDALKDELLDFRRKYLMSESEQTLILENRPLADALEYLELATDGLFGADYRALSPPCAASRLDWLDWPRINRLDVECVASRIDRLETARDILRDVLDGLVSNARANRSESPPTPADQEIVETLRSVGHRLTTIPLIEAMQKRGLIPSESTVKKRLAVMVDDGRLDNDPHGRPRGYGLPEWNGPSGSSGS
jgi:hypothetical protein